MLAASITGGDTKYATTLYTASGQIFQKKATKDEISPEIKVDLDTNKQEGPIVEQSE